MEREERLTRAVEQYGQELLRYCHHILCDYHEAQDAVQTAFLKAWERAGSMPVGGGSCAPGSTGSATRPAWTFSALLFADDGTPLVAVGNRRGRVRQGQYLMSYCTACTLTDTRTGEHWDCHSYVWRGGDDGFYFCTFEGCPITQEDLPYYEVTVNYGAEKVLSDTPVELSFSAETGKQTVWALDQDIAFNYIGDFSAHITQVQISALRLRLAFDQGQRAGWDWDHRENTSAWALLYKDGSRVPLGLPAIKDEEQDGTGWISLEGRDENGNRLLIDPDQAEALLVGEISIPLAE